MTDFVILSNIWNCFINNHIYLYNYRGLGRAEGDTPKEHLNVLEFTRKQSFFLVQILIKKKVFKVVSGTDFY